MRRLLLILGLLLAGYGKADELVPQSSADHLKRGSQRKQQGDWEGAIADYTKAIELNPKSAYANYKRGSLHYDLHEKKEALADFRQAFEVNPTMADYALCQVWLIRARLGESEAATREIVNFLDAHAGKKPEEWSFKILHFLAGQLREEGLLNAAKDPDPETDKWHHCEAYFYVGTKRLIAGDKAGAQADFEKCLATKLIFWTEYSSAAAELKFLKTL